MKAGGAGRRGEHSEVPRQHGRRKEAATPSEGWEQGEGVGRGVPACRRAGVQRALRATRPSHQGSVWSVVSHMHAPTPASAMRVSAGALLPIQLACAGPRPWCERVGAGARWRPGFEFNTLSHVTVTHTRSAGRLQNQRPKVRPARAVTGVGVHGIEFNFEINIHLVPHHQPRFLHLPNPKLPPQHRRRPSRASRVQTG